jgi:sulfotransferase family protein
MTTVLYIAGYGRCGSTVLAAILGNHPKFVSPGEVTYLYDDWGNAERTCSCGQRYGACEFWKGLALDSGPELVQSRLVRQVERASSLARLWLGWISEEVRETYRNSQQALFHHITSRGGATIVVDSSKSARFTAGRAIALRKLAGHDVYLLHLVRDGRATVESRVVTGSNWSLEGYARVPRLPTLRAVLGWMWSNCYASLTRRAFGDQHYLRLRYEDFVSNPAAWLQRIGEFLNVDTVTLIERVDRGEAFEVGHMVGGNRVRFVKAIVLRKPVDLRNSEGDGAGGKLTRRQRLLFLVLAGWLNRSYGYPT